MLLLVLAATFLVVMLRCGRFLFDSHKRNLENIVTISLFDLIMVVFFGLCLRILMSSCHFVKRFLRFIRIFYDQVINSDVLQRSCFLSADMFP